MTATPLHPYFAPNGWAITGLTAVGQTFRAVIERPSTQTAIQAAGPSPEAAIAEAWRLAGMIEDAPYDPEYAVDRVAQMGRDD